jgi:hypothetical protein
LYTIFSCIVELAEIRWITEVKKHVSAAWGFFISLAGKDLHRQGARRRPHLHVIVDDHEDVILDEGESGTVLFERSDGRGVRIAPMPRQRVKLQGHRAHVAARNAALLVLAERGLSSSEIASLPGIDLDERTIREGIAKARRLRDDWRHDARKRPDPKVIPLFGCQPWDKSKEELPKIGASCSHCGKRIERGEALYCPKCAATGFDHRLARELGEAIRRIPPPVPPAKSKLQSRGIGEAPGSPSPPKLTPSHRIELARTPQGFLWLKSIGQLPDEPKQRRLKEKRKKKGRD